MTRELYPSATPLNPNSFCPKNLIFRFFTHLLPWFRNLQAFYIFGFFQARGGDGKNGKTLRISLVFLFDLFKIPSSGVIDFLGFADTPRNLIIFLVGPIVSDGYCWL
ncbi:hypothetical protein HKD37_15G044081 [Glycine soja]